MPRPAAKFKARGGTARAPSAVPLLRGLGARPVAGYCRRPDDYASSCAGSRLGAVPLASSRWRPPLAELPLDKGLLWRGQGATFTPRLGTYLVVDDAAFMIASTRTCCRGPLRVTRIGSDAASRCLSTTSVTFTRTPVPYSLPPNMGSHCEMT